MRCPRSVTGLIDRAERRGLVRRRSTPADGRAVLVSCTTEGRRLIDQVGPTIMPMCIPSAQRWMPPNG
jgi:DNA-binding MarR family transcriptional regulator